MEMEKTPAWFHWSFLIIFVVGEFSTPSLLSSTSIVNEGFRMQTFGWFFLKVYIWGVQYQHFYLVLRENPHPESMQICWGSGDYPAIWLAFLEEAETIWGCRKFLLLFGRIGPLALRPCALLRAWGFLPHSINILQIPLWYGDMMWYGVSCACPCSLLRGPAFLMPLYHALKILSPEDVIERTGFFINPHMMFGDWKVCWQ